MGISQRAYAKQRGVNESAIRKAIKAGRITLLADGTIDPNRADRDWQQNTDVTKNTVGNSTAPVRTQDTAGTTLIQARTICEVNKAQTGKIKLAKLKGELVDRSHAIALVYKLARTERDAWLNWTGRISAQMAASLGIDAHTLHSALENAVRDHLAELGDLRPRVD
jgi:hypothetical protein